MQTKLLSEAADTLAELKHAIDVAEIKMQITKAKTEVAKWLVDYANMMQQTHGHKSFEFRTTYCAAAVARNDAKIAEIESNLAVLTSRELHAAVIVKAAAAKLAA